MKEIKEENAETSLRLVSDEGQSSTSPGGLSPRVSRPWETSKLTNTKKMVHTKKMVDLDPRLSISFSLILRLVTVPE